jgi:asparagine synthase (glutamine-hydrolysing)
MGALFGYCGTPRPGLLERMAQRLAHRSRGGWEQCRSDLSRRGQMQARIGHGIAPFNSESHLAKRGPACLGYTGALYRVPQSAPDLASSTKAQRLLSAIITGGTNSAQSLDGAFVLAWYDGEALYLMRDATGIKALYWAKVGQCLLFASETKALFADPALLKALRPGALAEYFTFSFVPGEGTMLEDVYELQPGCLLEFRDARVQIHRWFRFEDLEWIPQHQDPDSTHIDRIRRVLAASTEACVVNAPATPGCFLSGGIDSSAVLAMAKHLYPEQRFPTFSVHFGAEYPHEREFIDLMVRHCRTEHHLLEVRPKQFSNRLEEICWHLDDPIGDPVTMPNYLLAEYAARYTPVVLNGEGGDPCFGGPKNIPMLLSGLYGHPTDEEADGWLERQYLYAFQRAYPDLQRLFGPELRQACGSDRPLIALIRPFLRGDRPHHPLNKLMAMNIRLKGATLILVKVDKMTSANGLLALPPLFSRTMVEASMRVPPRLKLEGAVEKSILKRAVADLVPRTIIERPKSGMRVPVHYWFQGELRRFARRRLSKRRMCRLGLFDPDYIQQIVKYDTIAVPGQRHGLKLWMLLTFLLWYEQFFGEAI